MKRTYLKILVIGALLSLACTTKVSEWVLLNSDSEKYLLVYFHQNELTESEIQQNKELENHFTPANLFFKTIKREDIEKPYFALYFNNQLISEYAGSAEMKNIVTSPLREKTRNELIAGKLCVMVYLKCGNNEKDAKGWSTLNQTLEASPFGKIISLVELDRNSVEESLFVSMLLNVESDLKEIQEPMLFGVFGRFRALEPLLAKGISAENINLMIDFLTADCSCLIKDQLPGQSILCKDNWDDPQPALVNAILDATPELMHR
jgi:hypothetical protein